MSRFRLLPTPAQQLVLLEHCRHARFVWNLAVEQQQFWQPGRRTPEYNEQSAQLTQARAEYDWLAVFACVSCAAGPCNADVNAARNIAAGRAVPAQGDLAAGRSVNCEPQLSSPAA